jgi:hypothetical protein
MHGRERKRSTRRATPNTLTSADKVTPADKADPGSSNRAVADRSGITDRGQISKLLARLLTLGLVENTGGGPACGGPNAWTLTSRGWEVHGAIAHKANRA